MTSDALDDTRRPSSSGDVGRLVACRNAGLAACGLGVVVGIAMMARKREVVCADGTFFPEGATDFRCYAHPQALSGSAVVLMCLALAVVIVLCAVIAIRAVSLPHSDARPGVHNVEPGRQPESDID